MVDAARAGSGCQPGLTVAWRCDVDPDRRPVLTVCAVTVDTEAVTSLTQQWRDDLASWAIPEDIVRQAVTPPWAHAVSQFTVAGPVPDSLSHRTAREALPDGGSVLDVGCGGGKASFALLPNVGRAVGVDEQQGMLDAFAAGGAERGLAVEGILGQWPDVAEVAPVCDVVVCHHVLFNVPDLEPFLRALGTHARRRVVIEIPTVHPMSTLNPLWERFWGLTRPTRPTADDVVAILGDLGIDARSERWTNADFGPQADPNDADQVLAVTRRLCLADERAPEVADALRALGPQPPRDLVTIWWDVATLPA